MVGMGTYWLGYDMGIIETFEINTFVAIVLVKYLAYVESLQSIQFSASSLGKPIL
jgi:hypothetical protein